MTGFTLLCWGAECVPPWERDAASPKPQGLAKQKPDLAPAQLVGQAVQNCDPPWWVWRVADQPQREAGEGALCMC